MTGMTRTKGFTLIELMITLAVAAILAAIAAPSFSDLIRQNRLSAEVNTLIASLHLARTEAINRGVPVTMRRGGPTSQQWEDGWTVFTDWNGNGTNDGNPSADCTLEQQDCILRDHPNLSDGMTLRTGGGFADSLTYLPTGNVINTNGGLGLDTFRLCDQIAPQQGMLQFSREIRLTPTGRPDLNEQAGECP